MPSSFCYGASVTLFVGGSRGCRIRMVDGALANALLPETFAFPGSSPVTHASRCTKSWSESETRTEGE